jgi:hypothetical protein
MDRTSLVTLIIVAVIIFVIGGGLGIAYQAQKGVTGGAANAQAVVKTLSSKVVPSIIAYGTVSDIQGKTITLAYGTDSIKVPVTDGAQVFTFTQSTDPKVAPTQTKTDFSKIKKGDSLNVSLKLLPTGELQGVSVIILPAAGK